MILVIGGAACQPLGPTTSPRPGGTGAQSLRVASWNLHYIRITQPEGRWGLAGWEARKGALDAEFKRLGADIVAFQEMESFAGGDSDAVNLARSWLLQNNPGYRAAAIGDWRVFPSTQPIFYRPDRFDLLEQGWFFFSETPEVIYSRSFNGRHPTFASWARFRDRTSGETFRLLNLHFDHASPANARRSVDIVAARVAPWIDAEDAVILAGDFNALRGSVLHDRIEALGLAFVPLRGSSFHFGIGLHLYGAIDHIAVTPRHFRLRASGILRQSHAPPFATDHYPILADLALAP